MRHAQFAGDARELLHGVIRRADDAGGEEQPFDIVSAIEIDCQRHDLFHREAGARHVRGGAVDAIGAIEQAGIGEGGSSEARCIAHPVHRHGRCRCLRWSRGRLLPCHQRPARNAAARPMMRRSIIFRGISEEGEFGGDIKLGHGKSKCSYFVLIAMELSVNCGKVPQVSQPCRVPACESAVMTPRSSASPRNRPMKG